MSANVGTGQLINGAAHDELPKGHVRIDLDGDLEGEHVVINSRKFTRAFLQIHQTKAAEGMSKEDKAAEDLKNNDLILGALIESVSMDWVTVDKDSDNWSSSWPMGDFYITNTAIWARLNEYIGGPKKQTLTDSSTVSSAKDDSVM